MKTILMSFSSYCKQHLWGTLTQKWCEITLLLRWKVLPFSIEKKDFISAGRASWSDCWQPLECLFITLSCRRAKPHPLWENLQPCQTPLSLPLSPAQCCCQTSVILAERTTYFLYSRFGFCLHTHNGCSGSAPVLGALQNFYRLPMWCQLHGWPGEDGSVWEWGLCIARKVLTVVGKPLWRICQQILSKISCSEQCNAQSRVWGGDLALTFSALAWTVCFFLLAVFTANFEIFLSVEKSQG